MSRTGLIYDEFLTKHSCLWDGMHPESPERYTKCLESIRYHGLLERCTVLEPRDATKEELRLLHTVSQIEALENTKLNPEPVRLKDFCDLSDGVYANEHTYDVAVRAAGCAIELTDQIMKGKLDNGLAVIRPPGHNASSKYFSKFCFFNNVALAARYAVNVLRVPSVLIVDWNIEHGNGTQETFYNDPRVLYFSIHRFEQGAFWPYLRLSDFDQIGRDTAAGHNVNVPLNSIGLENSDYLAIFHQLLLPIAAEFRPKLILVSCGFGASLGDPEGGMRITPVMYAHMTRMLQVLAPMSVILEGGYCIPAVADGVALVLKTLLNDPCPRMINIWRKSRPTDPTVVESIESTITVLKRYWKCLGHHKAVEDIRARIRFTGRGRGENGFIYEKPTGAIDPTALQMLEDLRRQTRLITADSPRKYIGDELIEQPLELKKHRFVLVDSLSKAQNLVAGSSLLVNFADDGATAFEESGSTIIINAQKLQLENAHDAVISMYSLVLPVYYNVYPEWIVLNGFPADSKIALKVLFSLCCAHLSCEGGLILIGSEPQCAELPTDAGFNHNAKLAADNIREAARTFELEIDQFVERIIRPRTPTKFDEMKSIAVHRCRGCYNSLKPETPGTRRLCCCCGFFGLIILMILITVWVIVPSTFCSSSEFRRWLLLESAFDDEFDYARPELRGLHCPTSYLIGYGKQISLGLWYIPPRVGPCAEEIKDCCKKGPVFIYFHGLPGHRGKYINIPKFLAEKINAHVFTFDYQGSGESTENLPSRETILLDSLAILDTVLDVVPLERIFFWGHSLGASIAVDVAANISVPFGGLILEAPLSDMARRIEMGKGLGRYALLPIIRSCVIDSARNDVAINYNSTKTLQKVSTEVPVLILHAEDDELVPFTLGRELYEEWFRYRVETEGAFVSMLAFEKKFGFGHDDIYKYERLQDVVRQFLFRVPLGPGE